MSQQNQITTGNRDPQPGIAREALQLPTQSCAHFPTVLTEVVSVYLCAETTDLCAAWRAFSSGTSTPYSVIPAPRQTSRA